MPTIELKYVFADEAELRAHLGLTTSTAPAPAAAVSGDGGTATEPTRTGAEPTRDALDGDGMPYNEAIHADPPSFTTDGLWRAQRGKSEEAKTARAAFKAAGGTIVPPEVKSLPAPALPAAVATAPVLPAPALPPVTIEALIEAIGTANQAGKLTDLSAFYAKHTGSSDGDVVLKAIEANESIRRKMLDEIAGL